ncbi:TetR/AcrR family transcriptional regulator [Antrihabitans stalactiti]|uniref:TetR/AcrR family transcriptional regulator n=1 Tax=Antrihabitans stalactiti TaxID=2584121 RepID=A0A848KQR4_9NOCA|nr:TetR/AcrR family transcriptional regulator [Antrihabitans stalactiti]NMN98610.1 TetR/AcrR family transcriptional regulator [Antrihabitans stalactiti]
MSRDWLADGRSSMAADRILDAAAREFVEKGVPATGMGDIARAAGCSRATLYRYFENRRALHVAFIHRAARQIGRRIAETTRQGAEPGDRVVEAMLTALREVRADPTLVAWFRAGEAGIAIEIAHSSEVIGVLGAAIVGDAGADETQARRLGAWLVRVTVSLLAVPGRDEDDERAMLEQFVVPLLKSFSVTH